MKHTSTSYTMHSAVTGLALFQQHQSYSDPRRFLIIPMYIKASAHFSTLLYKTAAGYTDRVVWQWSLSTTRQQL